MGAWVDDGWVGSSYEMGGRVQEEKEQDAGEME